MTYSNISSSIHSKLLYTAHPVQDGEEDEGNASEGTIYESIENLVLQFDATMRDATQALGQLGMKGAGGGGGGKKRKKKSLVRQGSLFSSKGEGGRKGRTISKVKVKPAGLLAV